MNNEDIKAKNSKESHARVLDVLTDECILEKTGREYYASGNDEIIKGRHNSALVLFFKALLSFCDLYLLKETGRAPLSHADRFRVTRDRFTDIYILIDKDFPFYTDSYGKIISKNLTEVIKQDAETMAAKVGIKL